MKTAAIWTKHCLQVAALLRLLLLQCSSCLVATGNAQSSIKCELTAPNTSTISDPLAARVSTTVRTHTLILCRHGDSIWNGGHPGHSETFTGWSDVELSPRGVLEASQTAQQLADTYPYGIDACFTSILQRARLTAHECVWAYGDMPTDVQVGRFVSDYRLNERHYGALQGFIKADVEAGVYGHDPVDVERWRRSWYAVPPLLDEEDPRRIEEIRKYGHCCGGSDNVPKGESLAMVARERIRPFLEEVLTPTLDEASVNRGTDGSISKSLQSALDNFFGDTAHDVTGGTGLVVAHANSLRALIGVVCGVENDPVALERVEQMKIQTGVPLIMRYKSSSMSDGSIHFKVCNQGEVETSDSESVDLPIWALASIPFSGSSRTKGQDGREQRATNKI